MHSCARAGVRVQLCATAKRQAFKMHPPSAAILPSVRHKAFALNAAARLCTSLTGLSFGRWRRQLHMLVAL
jgi:hypothetical protein